MAVSKPVTSIHVNHSIPLHVMWGLLSTTLMVQYMHRIPVFFVLYVSVCAHLGILFMTSLYCDVTPPRRHRHDVIGAIFVVIVQIAVISYYVKTFSIATLLLQGLAIAFFQFTVHMMCIWTSGKRLTQHISISSLSCL